MEDTVSKKDLEEEHTRELQVEQAYKLFQSALKLQKQKQYESAYKVYEELFKLDIVSNHYFEELDFIRGLQDGSQNTDTDELTLLSPNVKSLRYLIFRNRGFLYLDMLKSNTENKSAEKVKEMFYPLLDDFCIALLYNEPDEKLLETLHEIFSYIGSERLSRFVLEYSLTSRKESDDLSGLLPIDQTVLSQYKTMLEHLLSGKFPKLDLKHLLFLEPIRLDILAQQEKLASKKVAVIKSTSTKWVDLLDAINIHLKENQDESKIEDANRPRIRIFEPYVLTEEPLDIVRIEFTKRGVAVPATETEVTKAQPEQIVQERKPEEDNRVQRSSKRLSKVEDEIPAVTLESSHFLNMDYFRNQMNETIPNFEIFDVCLTYVEDGSGAQYIKDFKNIVSDWNDSYARAILSYDTAKSEDDNLKLLDLLSGYGKSEELKEKNIPLLGEIDIEFPELNYVEFKTYIIKHLLSKILTTKWSDKLYEKFTEWIVQFEGYIINDIDVELAIGVLEVLVDISTSLESQIKDSINNKLNKAVVNSMCQDLLRIKDKIIRWINYIETFPINDLQVASRFKWCQIIKEKAETKSWTENHPVKHKLQKLLGDAHFKINYPNYKNFIDFSKDSINSQLTIISVLAIFWRILSTSSTEDNKEAIRLLEDILLDLNTEPSDAILSIRNFLKQGSIDMKLSLWNILLLFYQLSNSGDKLAVGFEECVLFLNDYLVNEYVLLDEESRLVTLLRILGFYGSSILFVVTLLASTNWILMYPIKVQTLRLFFELSLLFEINEEASYISSLATSIKSKSTKSYHHLTNTLIKTIILILASIQKSNPQILHSVIRLFHTQLGLIGICGHAGGSFLEIAQEYLKSLPNSDQDICQIIKCKYHYSISIDGVVPADHGTARLDELNKNDCKELALFVLPLCFLKGGSTLNNVPKHDIKLLIDEIYDVIGDPDFDLNEALGRNKATLNYFLDNTRLTKRLFQEAFHGLVRLELGEAEEDKQFNGLYYIEGLLLFSSYKLRKKNMQSRAVELESAISLFENDIICGSNRFESWFLLGQSYGYLVEDDLIWTADKLTASDRKITTANLQRKSLICYLMAINKSLDESIKDVIKPVVGNLMSLFAKEMFSAVCEPMSMHAFKVQSHPRFINRVNGALFEPVSQFPAVDKTVCLKIIQQSLQLSIKSSCREWSDYYYLAKVQRKLDKPAGLVMETMASACRSAFKNKHADNIIEPHYNLVSFALKYVKSNRLDSKDALKYLIEDPLIKLEVGEETDFIKLIIKALNKIDLSDKKNWQHKAKYRLARLMQEEYHDVKGAIDQMSSFISLKTPNKALVLIWKPEPERPGKHFLYTFQYIHFYIELLKEIDDLDSLVAMLPKLRRSNSVMINLSIAWEILCSSVCKIIRESYGIGDNFEFTENLINTLPYQTFAANVKLLPDMMRRQSVPENLKSVLCFLFTVNDIKKLNNGYGPTSFIDDTLVTLYFMIYLNYFEKSSTEVTTDSPGLKKKIAKRDIFPLTNDILKAFKKDIEDVTKQKSYNELITAQKLKQGLNEDKLLENVPASANVNEIIVIDDDDDDNLSQEPATKKSKTESNSEDKNKTIN